MSRRWTPNDRRRSPRMQEADLILGGRLRQARELRGISQKRLGALAEISFQQMQKYEAGRNRVAASRLAEFSLFLGLPMAWFTDPVQRFLRHPMTIPKWRENELITEAKMKEAGRIIYAIPDPLIRQQILDLARRHAEVGAEPPR